MIILPVMLGAPAARRWLITPKLSLFLVTLSGSLQQLQRLTAIPNGNPYLQTLFAVSNCNPLDANPTLFANPLCNP